MEGLIVLIIFAVLVLIIVSKTAIVVPQQSAYVVERLVNQAATELGIDPPELRRRNFIAPEAFPYKTATGSVFCMGVLLQDDSVPPS